MNAYQAVSNFRNAFDSLNYMELCSSLKNTFQLWKGCCENEDFDNPKISHQLKQFFMLHDMMAIHYGYWGYLEFEDVRNSLQQKLWELCKKSKKEMVDFYVNEYLSQIENRAKTDLMEAQGVVHVIDCSEME